MGHVPPGPLRLVGAGGHVQGRQRRGAPGEGAVAIPGPAHGRQALGRAGEDRAAEWYERQGYRLVARNWRCRDGELDLVARLGPTLVFCEVKSRTTAAFGVPAEAVTAAKQARLRRLAARWLAEHPGSGAGRIRFDVATVLSGRLEVLEGAF